MTEIPEVVIYTDGACAGNPGAGGWGAILEFRDKNNKLIRKEISGCAHDTTNNQMELQAAIEALSCLKKRSIVKLYTDSIYVKNGITEWILSWKINNWRTSSKKPVKNLDLWMKLDELASQHQIQWNWVKGHSGHIGNEKADKLACEARDQAINSKLVKGTNV